MATAIFTISVDVVVAEIMMPERLLVNESSTKNDQDQYLDVLDKYEDNMLAIQALLEYNLLILDKCLHYRYQQLDVLVNGIAAPPNMFLGVPGYTVNAYAIFLALYQQVFALLYFLREILLALIDESINEELPPEKLGVYGSYNFESTFMQPRFHNQHMNALYAYGCTISTSAHAIDFLNMLLQEMEVLIESLPNDTPLHTAIKKGLKLVTTVLRYLPVALQIPSHLGKTPFKEHSDRSVVLKRFTESEVRLLQHISKFWLTWLKLDKAVCLDGIQHMSSHFDVRKNRYKRRARHCLKKATVKPFQMSSPYVKSQGDFRGQTMLNDVQAKHNLKILKLRSGYSGSDESAGNEDIYNSDLQNRSLAKSKRAAKKEFLLARKQNIENERTTSTNSD